MDQQEGVAGAVNLTISLCLVCIVFASIVRVRFRVSAYGIDDVVTAVAVVVAFGHTAADYVAFGNGIGSTTVDTANSDTIRALNKASIAGVVTCTTALYASKCSVIVFLLRATRKRHRITVYISSVLFIAAAGIISQLLVLVDRCPSRAYYWTFVSNEQTSSCLADSPRWQIFTGVDIATEILVLILPAQLVWGSHLPPSKKALLLALFGSRLPTIGFSLARNHYTLSLRLPQTDPGIASGFVVIWLEVELAYALVSGTLLASQTCSNILSTALEPQDRHGQREARGRRFSDASSTNLDIYLRSRRPPVMQQMPRAPPPSKAKSNKSIEVVVSPLSQRSGGGGRTKRPSRRQSAFLHLRPEREFRTVTSIVADPSPTFKKNELWPHSRAGSSQYSAMDDMVILRKTEYDVQHDEVPMLQQAQRSFSC